MMNVSTRTENNGTKLVIEVDLTQDFGPSKSGKTNMVASTSGFIQVAPGVSLGLNVVKKQTA